MATPPRTPDGHHVVVDGRRWRATDPAIPEDLRQELVDELMAARREVGAGRGDDERVAAARARVQDAKVALGERGHPWWEEHDDEQLRGRLVAVLRTLRRARGDADDGDGSDGGDGDGVVGGGGGDGRRGGDGGVAAEELCRAVDRDDAAARRVAAAVVRDHRR